ncbi:MAG: hypothetical protein P8P45_00620 [Flavobacteriales bacterium]|nr:hypothetical protein [Flavobacteriales bacterium]
MDVLFEQQWRALLNALEQRFGGGMDLQDILYLVGVQELGKGFQKFKKQEKMDLMHVAVCTVLTPQGFYKFVGRDDDGWPHFESQISLPELEPKAQDALIRRALIDYFGPDLDRISGPQTA